jgi:hypothetical protein
VNKRTHKFGWLFWVAVSAGGAPAPSLSPAVVKNLARLPLAFEKQGDRFVARGQGYVVGVANGKVLIGAREKDKSSRFVSLEFAGSKSSRAIPGAELPGKINYIRGNDPHKWQIGLPTYARVTYPDTYPGIDVVYRGNQQELEFDLVVKPGADPEAIRLKVGGAGQLSIDSSGALILGEAAGALGEAAGALRIALPQIYQEVNGSRKSVPGYYAIVGRDEVAFRIDPWDRTRPLVIDPTIVYSVLLGGGLNSNGANAIGLDSMGNVLIAGYTYALDFPTVSAAQNRLNGSPNVIVTKTNPAGTAFLYSTYFGGSGHDYANGLAVDSTGAAWVTGETQSSDFPVLNAVYPTYSGRATDGFVARFSATGVLQFSTFLGGNAAEYGAAIAVDSSDNGYVTGRANGSFPTTTGVIDTANPGYDAFVTKYGPAGTVAWSTLLGGGNTSGSAIAVDSLGDAYVTGTSYDSTFTGAPAGGAQTTNQGNGDAFVAKLNPGATAMLYFTFLGGTGADSGTAIGVDALFNAYIAGTTSSNGLASGGAAQTALPGAANGFAAKLNPAGSAFTWVTYLGGSRVDYLNGLAVDGSGNVYLAGTTDSANFPAVSALQPTLPGNGISLFNSANSGGSWTAADTNIPGVVFDASINPAGTSAVVLTESGIYRTVNGGASWTQQFAMPLGQAAARSGFHLGRSPAVPGTIYAAVCCSSIYESSDDGQTWALRGSVSTQAEGIVADPLTAGTVYVFGFSAPYLFSSTNGGTTWNPAATGLPGTLVTAMAATGGSLYAGTAGAGIYTSTNQGGSWVAVNTGLPANATARANSLSASGTTVYFADGNIYETTAGSGSWIAAPDYNIGADSVAASAQNAAILYAFTVEGTVLESSNGGATWSMAGTGLPPGISYSNSELLVDPSNSANVFVVAPVNQAGFVAKLNNTGSGLTWSTYLGGTGVTDLQAVATDGLGDAFVTGATYNGSFPVTSSALPAGTADIFLTEISDATAACSTPAVSPESALAPQNGGAITFNVVSPSGCAWTAATNQSWAPIISGVSGTGSGTVIIQTAANSGSATQSAVLVVGNQNVTITQPSGSCVFSLDKSSYPVAWDGGTVSVVLTATAGCPWLVTNNYSSAISITSSSSGIGSAGIVFKVARNLTGSARNFSLPVGTAQIQIAQAAGATPSGTATTTTLSSSGNPSTFGKILTLTATVSPAAATGKVTFYAGSTVLGTGTLTGGEATLTTILVAAGKRPLRALYQGAGGYASSTSSTLSQTVVPVAGAGFAGQVTYGTGNGPYVVAEGDFNGDGIADVAVANSNDSNISVLLGNGNGTFNTAVSYGTGNGPHSVVVGDFNGDGNLDLATANHYGGNISVLLGKGDGTFNTAAGYPAGISPWTVVAGDFNGDGIIDLAVTNYGGGNVSVLLGNGDGTFTAATTPDAGTGPIGAVTGDFNGDGITDLAVANNGSGNVSILLGNGDGSFQSAMNYSAGQSPYGVVVSDFNADGKADLAVGLGSTSVAVLFGNGDGSFQPAVPYGTFISPVGLAAGDFNADGIPDIVAADDGAGGVGVLLGKGDGTFLTPFTYTAGAGSLSVVVGDFNGDGIPDLITANNANANISVLLGVAPTESQTITFGALSNVGLGALPYTISGTASSGLPVTFFSTTTAVCTVAGTTVSIVGLGTCSITAAQPGNNTYGAAVPVTRSFTVAQGSQAITFGALSNVAVGIAPFTLSATATSGLAVTFASTTNAVCTVSGTTATIVAVGTCAITATQAGNADYAAANPVTQSFLVAAASQTITFGALSNVTFGVAPFTVSATATSGLAVTFASATNAVCTVSGTTVTIVAGGTCSITASQAGNVNFGAASPVTQSFLVAAASQTITFGALSNVTFGVAPFAVSATATSGLAVTFASTTNAVCTVSGTTVTIVAGGTCSITASQAGNANYLAASAVTQSFLVAAASQTITFGALSNVGFGALPYTVLPTASSGLPVTLSSTTTAVCTVAGTTVSIVGAGTCSLTAAQPGNNSYAAAAPVTQSFTVSPGSQTITFGALSNVTFGVAPFAVSATATSGLAVTFGSTTNAVCTVSGTTVTIVAGGTCSITASQAGNGNYTAANPLARSFTVNQASQTIVFEPVNNQPIGTAPFPLLATATSGLGVTFVSSNPLVCTVSGNTVTLARTGFCSIAAFQTGNATFTAATPVARSFDVTAALNPSGTLASSSGSPFAVGTNPNSVVVGDFNEDGIADVAVANAGGNTVTVLLGNGSGGFTPAPGSPFAVGAYPYSLAVGDFNGDGVADLATANYHSNNVTVLLGNGSGGFTAATGSPFAAGALPLSVAVADFNGDGMADIATANYVDGTVTVLLGNGSGGFTPAAGSPVATGRAPTSLVVGDFNRDGIPDIATSDDYLTGTVTVLLGNGSGGFTAATGSPFATGPGALYVVARDFNGDGILDLATANSTGNSVTVLLGNGSGGFTAEAPFAVGTGPSSLVAGDFNGDGIPDLAAANEMGGSVTVLLGNGSGGFAAAAGSPFAAGASPVSVAVGDFNGDGRPDLAAANFDGNNVTVLLGTLAGTSSLLSTTSPSTIGLGAAVPLSLAVSDSVTAFNAPTGTVTFLDGTTTIGTASQTTNPWTFSTSSLALGTHTLTANYSGDTRSLGSSSNSITILVNGTSQTITFGPLGSQVLGSTPPPLSATASSGLAVTFTSGSSSVCTVSGVDITLVAAGTCSITASQPGNSVYAAATPVTQTFVVLGSVQPVAAFLDQNGAPALTFNGSTNFPDAGGFLIGAPGVTEDLNGNVYVVGLDSAGGVHLNSYSSANAVWNGWQYSGGILDTSSGLTAAVDPNGVVWFTGRDIGNRFWINSWNGMTFGGWILVADGIFASDSVPQIAIPSDGSIYVIGKDIGGRIWSNSYIPSSQTFTGWVDRQAVMIGQPSATAGQDGMVYVAVRSVSSESPVYITQIPPQNAATANTWQNGGGQIDTDPQITSQGGTVYLLAEADGDTVYLLTFAESDQTFGTWSFTNGILNDSTIAAAAGNPYIAGRDSSGRIYWYSVTGNNWFLAGGAGISSTVLTGAK